LGIVHLNIPELYATQLYRALADVVTQLTTQSPYNCSSVVVVYRRIRTAED